MEKRLKDVLEDMVDERYYLKPSQVEAILKHCDRKISEGCGFKPQLIERDGVSAAITSKYGLRQTDPLVVERAGFNVDEDGCSRTIFAHYAQAGNPAPHTCVLESRILTQRRTEEGREMRKRGIEEFKYKGFVPREDGVCNAITTVEKDNYVLETATREACERILDGEPGMVIGNTQLNCYRGSVDDCAPCICAAGGMGGGHVPMVTEGLRPLRGSSEPKIIQMPHGFFGGAVKDVSPAVTSSAFADNNYLLVEHRIRKLTERECFRLMGLCDADIDKILNAEEEITLKSGKKKTRRAISKTACYDLAGNSIVVDVLEYIFENLFINKAARSDGRQLTLF